MSRKSRGGRFSRKYVSALLERVDFYEVVSSLVGLRHINDNYAYGKCLIHQERTPSFSFSKNKEMAHCFGCGTHRSDVISFVAHVLWARDYWADDDPFTLGRSRMTSVHNVRAICWLAKKYKYWPNTYKREQKESGRTR